jgi:hypothetical protein
VGCGYAVRVFLVLPAAGYRDGRVKPALLMLCIVAWFILLKIPTMTASLFSGHTGGHGSGMGGLITAAVLKGF